MNKTLFKIIALATVLSSPLFVPAQNFVDERYPGLYFKVENPNQTALLISGTEMGYEKYSNTSYNIPESVKYQNIDLIVIGIADKAFYGCDKVKSVNLPSKLETIGDWSFYNSGLNPQIIIPNSITTIGEYAFALCSNLSQIDLSYHNSLTSIGRSAFSFSGLRDVTIPANVSSIGTNAFANCEQLKSLQVDVNNSIFDSRNKCNAIIHKSSKTVVFGCSGTENIPEGVASIGDNAFYGSKLDEISLPSSITSIGDWAFFNCSLKEMILPDEVYSIGEYSFALCSELSKVKLSSSLLSIGRSAFSSSGLLDIIIPQTVVSIGKNAFANCKDLTKIQVEDNNTTYTSKNSYGIECNAIFQGNVLVIGCTGTTVIPKEVKTIAENAFYGSGVNSIEFESPSSVETIEEWAFYNCDNLISARFPDKLKYIEEYAYSLCSSLSTIELPANLKSISKNAFSNCNNLTGIYSLIQSPFRIAENVFGESYNKATLYVPIGSKSLYEQTDFWSKFGYYNMIQEKDYTGIETPTFAGLRIYSSNGVLYIESTSGGNCSVYAISGQLMRKVALKQGLNTVEGLSKGIYIVNGQKIMVR